MMRKVLFLLIIFTLCLKLSHAQKDQINNLPTLSEEDKIWLSNLPKLELPPEFLKPGAPLLPEAVDNSTLDFWRPVFAQESYECGQASSVGLGFSYQINRMRNVSGTDTKNQYPPYFPYNWANEGNAWHGVSYFHTFEVLKYVGVPTVEDYGGMTAGGETRWMTGYDMYYDAMKNRISEAYQIDCSTPEGILTLKHWIHNYLEGAETGGVANFYANAPSASYTLPPGTPEAGMYVVPSWGGANHAMTIAAYHDSIRYDYNNDGQYTNHLDINNDGKVDVQDWEIGGFRFANTYSGGPGFANEGFCYMMYKSLADPYGSGGIWNNAVHVQYAKADMEPQLTAKITLKHKSRNSVRVRMGVSTDPEASSPDFILGYPIFNYQGGTMFMQGGYELEENKTIEFGLDLTPLLNLIGSGVNARYFLLVDDEDPNLIYEGELISFSLMDYTNGVEEIEFDGNNIILNNGLNSFEINHTITFNEPVITDENLPDITAYSQYEHQLSATGGSEPYVWEHDQNFTEVNYTESFPNISDEQLSVNNNNSGYATKDINFTFPFYDKNYNQIRVYVDGYIRFEPFLNDWPYQSYDFLFFTKNLYIAPLMADLKIIPDNDDGIWCQNTTDYAIFRWKVSDVSLPLTYHFAVKLTKDGEIFYYYGDNPGPMPEEWISAVSKGDNKYYQFTAVSGHDEIASDFVCELTPFYLPEGLNVDRYGKLSGSVYEELENYPIKFKLTDENNISTSKVLNLSTDGSSFLVLEDFTVNAEGDEVIEYGETALLSLDIKNFGDVSVSDGYLEITSNDPYITLIDNTEDLGSFEAGETKSFQDILSFEVANDIPDNYTFELMLETNCNGGNDWNTNILLTGYAANLTIESLVFEDGENGQVDPGENIELIMNIFNEGGSDIQNINFILNSNSEFISINSEEDDLAFINAGSTGEINFNFDVSEEVENGYAIEFSLNITADNDYEKNIVFFIVVGLNMETYETGNFLMYAWEFEGDADWVIDDTQAYEGLYSAKSGIISDEESSAMTMEVCVVSESEISFFAKVSSEDTYDFMRFYIDGAEYLAICGETNWTQYTYTVDAGTHTLKWAYEKDYSVSNGSDCAWVDNVAFPVFGDPAPQISIDPEEFYNATTEPAIITDTIRIINEGSGLVAFEVDVEFINGSQNEWITFDIESGSVNAGETANIIVSFNPMLCNPVENDALIYITDHMDNVYEIDAHLSLLIGTDEVFFSHENIYPNPFSNNVYFNVRLLEADHFELKIYNTSSQLIKTIIHDEQIASGQYLLSWDGTDASHNDVSDGIYFYELTIGNHAYSGKLIKTK